MMLPGPKSPCPECGASNPHHPWGDVLILRCQCCGFAIGADDLHTCIDNWKRRARTRTEVWREDDVRPDPAWKLAMSADERMDLIGCTRKTFAQLAKLPCVSRGTHDGSSLQKAEPNQ